MKISNIAIDIISKTNFAGFVVLCIVGIGIFSIIGCGCTDKDYIDDGADAYKPLLASAGESVTFQDQLGSVTVLEYSTPQCVWSEYSSYYPECTYIRHESCTQEANALMGENLLQHRLSISGGGLWFSIENIQVSSTIQNNPNEQGYSFLDSLVIFDNTYYALTRYDVTDTSSTIDFVVLSANDKLLQVKLNDGTSWSRME